jgi:hypothetical protein
VLHVEVSRIVGDRLGLGDAINYLAGNTVWQGPRVLVANGVISASEERQLVFSSARRA